MTNQPIEVMKLVQNDGFSKRIYRSFRKNVVEATWCLIFLLKIRVDPFVYSKSKYTLESVGVSGWPAIYTITPHNYIRLS